MLHSFGGGVFDPVVAREVPVFSLLPRLPGVFSFLFVPFFLVASSPFFLAGCLVVGV